MSIDQMRESIRADITGHQSRYLSELFSFLSYPSISTDPKYRSSVNDCAQFLKAQCQEIGLSNTQVIPTKGHPILFAQSEPDPNKKTLLIYGHYDVQPVDPLDQWDADPFDPVLKDGYMVARGAADDKGQVYAHLKAIESLQRVSGELPVNIKVLVEGEEEIGSPHLYGFLREYQDQCQADAILVSDTPFYSRTCPSICISLRGMLYVEVTMTGPSADLHSGQHGGAVANPIQGLAALISQLKDDRSRIQIPGFYDAVTPIGASLQALLDALPDNDAVYADSVGVSELYGEQGYGANAQKWFRPTLDCNGITGGYTGEGAKTIIPATASAKLSMRLVDGQDPDEIFASLTQYCQAHCPKGLNVKIKRHAGSKAYMADPDAPVIQMGKRALEAAFEYPAKLVGEGGSIPIVSELSSQLNAAVVLMGFNLPDDQIHAPNERFLVDHYYKGILATSLLMTALGGPK